MGVFIHFSIINEHLTVIYLPLTDFILRKKKKDFILNLVNNLKNAGGVET